VGVHGAQLVLGEIDLLVVSCPSVENTFAGDFEFLEEILDVPDLGFREKIGGDAVTEFIELGFSLGNNGGECLCHGAHYLSASASEGNGRSCFFPIGSCYVSERPGKVHFPVTDLHCGEFHRKRSYATRRPRGSGDWLLIYTVAGGGQFRTPHGSRTAGPGDAVLYAPEDFQDYGTSPEAGEWHLLWVHFAPKAQRNIWLRWPQTHDGVKMLHIEKGEVREKFRAAMHRMISTAQRQIPYASDLAGNALEEALLWAGVAASDHAWLAMDVRVRKASDYLVARMKEPFALEQLARHCGASVSRLAHLFKQQTGTSPRNFLEQHRMRHACELLRLTSLTVTEVAAEAGYPDAFYFSNRFRLHAGTSPSRFRRRSAVAGGEKGKQRR